LGTTQLAPSGGKPLAPPMGGKAKPRALHVDLYKFFARRSFVDPKKSPGRLAEQNRQSIMQKEFGRCLRRFQYLAYSVEIYYFAGGRRR
jgi:hypothetical protein